MNPFEKGSVESRLEAEEVIKTMELDVNQYSQLIDREIIRFANEILVDHTNLL